jgi:hypothetical protein
MVVIGDILVLEGTANSAVDGAGLFYFIPDEGQALVDGGELGVQLYEESLVLVGCDEEVSPEAIQSDMRARVAGKYSTSEGLLRAAVVFLGLQEVSGMITGTAPGEGGLYIMVQPDEGEEVTVFVSDSTPVYLEGDGLLDAGFLCVGKRVRVLLNPDTVDSEAQVIFVEPQEIIGEADFVGYVEETKVLIVDGISVTVQDNATILDLTGGVQQEVDFEDIEVGRQVRVFGTSNCDGEILGFTILVLETQS